MGVLAPSCQLVVGEGAVVPSYHSVVDDSGVVPVLTPLCQLAVGEGARASVPVGRGRGFSRHHASWLWVRVLVPASLLVVDDGGGE